MYHEDKGLIVDVELLAECGQIAQHLRKLERHWKINLKDLQKQSIRGFTKPPIPTTESVQENLNRIFDINLNQSVQLVNRSDDDDDDDDFDENFSKHVKYLEDIVIKIYQLKQKERIDSCFDDNRQTQQREEIVCKNSIESSSSGNKNNNSSEVHIKSNMNYSVAGATAEEATETATKHNNNELTASPLQTTDTRDDQHFEAHLCTQKQHQTETATVANIESSGSDNNNQSLMNNDSDKQEQDLNPATNIHDVGYIVRQQQQQLCAKITDEDFKILLREMKRKVEFTEKMNWLCKSLECDLIYVICKYCIFIVIYSTRFYSAIV